MFNPTVDSLRYRTFQLNRSNRRNNLWIMVIFRILKNNRREVTIVKVTSFYWMCIFKVSWWHLHGVYVFSSWIITCLREAYSYPNSEMNLAILSFSLLVALCSVTAFSRNRRNDDWNNKRTLESVESNANNSEIFRNFIYPKLKLRRSERSPTSAMAFPYYEKNDVHRHHRVPYGEQTSTVKEQHGIHVANWRWDEIGVFFTFTMFIVVTGLAKVGTESYLPFSRCKKYKCLWALR